VYRRNIRGEGFSFLLVDLRVGYWSCNRCVPLKLQRFRELAGFQKHLAIAGNLHQHRSFWSGNQTSRVTGLIRIAAMQ